MLLSAVILLTTALGADPAGSPADAARAVMRDALREAAPLAARRAALPEGPLPRGELTDAARALKRDANRITIEHAKKAVPAEVRQHHGRPGDTHGEASDMVHGHDGADPACEPADMMHERGMTPGGGHTTPMPGPHHGM